MTDIWFLENVDLYDILCPHKLGAYNASHFRLFKRGEFIYFKEDRSDCIYLVSQGKVKLLYYTDDGQEVVKAVLAKGEIFGEMALLGEEKRRDFAVALSETTSVCPLSTGTMYELMRDNQQFSLTIHKIIGSRMQRLERRLELLFFKDVRTRLIDFIEELMHDKGVKAGEEIRIQHAFTHKDIADLIGSTRETVTSLLNELKEEGIIHYGRNHLHVVDTDRLLSKVQ